MLPTVELPIAGNVTTYSIVLAVYLSLALLLTASLEQRQGIPLAITLRLFMLGAPLGLIGARALDVFEYRERYRDMVDVFGPNGSSIYGAFLLVLPVAALYLAAIRVPPLKFLDGAAPAMALGEACTRIGCFLNGCCYGVPWDGPLAVRFPVQSFAYQDQISRGLLLPGAAHSVSVVPVQLLSGGLALGAVGFLLWLFHRRHQWGTVFFSFVAFYGALRLAMAPLREERLGSMVALSLLFLAVGILGLAIIGLAHHRGPCGEGMDRAEL